MPQNQENIVFRASLSFLPIAILLATACAEPTSDPVEAGRRTYKANCIACHNPNPAIAGSLGPAVAGSSRELIEARVLRGEYPPGYKPKQDSTMMVPLPFLKNEIEGLAAYLQSPG